MLLPEASVEVVQDGDKANINRHVEHFQESPKEKTSSNFFKKSVISVHNES